MAKSPSDMSKLRLYSIGIVAKDKEKFADEIEVYLSEQMPFASGNIYEEKDPVEKDSEDSNGTPSTSKLGSSFTVTATWLPDGVTNQVTAPDVYANESVKVYKYADANEYYWKTLYREPKLRRQETVATMYSNQKEFGEEYTKESSYWTQVDTRDKKWQLHTADNDGEKAKYDAILDTKEGMFTFDDGRGNVMTLDSMSQKWNITNAAGNTLTMEGGNTTATTPSSYTQTSSSTSMSSSGATSVSAGSSMSMSAGGGLSMSAGGNSSMQSGGSIELSGKPIILNGDVIINGNLTVNGNITCNDLTANSITAGSVSHGGGKCC